MGLIDHQFEDNFITTSIDRESRRIPIPGLILETEEEKEKALQADERRAGRLKARKELEAR